MSVLDEQTRHTRRAVLDAADMNLRLVDGLEELCEARRRAYREKQVLEEDLSQVELVRDQLDEKAVRVKERRKDANKAQKDLDRLAAELGTEAFAAREVGDLADLSIFNERMQAQRQVDEWEGELTELGEAKGFGAVIKAKARQAQLLAKVTATKATFRGQAGHEEPEDDGAAHPGPAGCRHEPRPDRPRQPALHRAPGASDAPGLLGAVAQCPGGSCPQQGTPP